MQCFTGYPFLCHFVLQRCWRKWHINSFPPNETLDLTKLKAFADHKIHVHVTHIMIFAFDGTLNIAGKGENTGYQHFLPAKETSQF